MMKYPIRLSRGSTLNQEWRIMRSEQDQLKYMYNVCKHVFASNDIIQL